MEEKPSYYMLGHMKLRRTFKVTHSPRIEIGEHDKWICTECGAERDDGEKVWHWESCGYAMRQVIEDLCKHCGIGPGW